MAKPAESKRRHHRIQPLLGVSLSDDAAIAHLQQSYADAVQGVIDIINSDLNRKKSYAPVGLQPGDAAVTELSVFADCGLPFVPDFGSFLRDFLVNDIASYTSAFCGLKEDTASNIWNPGGPLGLAWYRGQYSDHMQYLCRLDWNDRIWRGEKQQKWVDTFGGGLVLYLTELFSGRFVDRNGTKIAFDFKLDLSDLTKLSQTTMSPQAAGEIVAALVEFVGDVAFNVPCYSNTILTTAGQYRGTKDAASITQTNLGILKAAITNGQLVPGDAAKVGIPLSGDLKWAALGGSPIVGDDLTRMVAASVGTLDTGYFTALLRQASLLSKLNAADSSDSKSEWRTVFTSYKAHVIKSYLKDQFLHASGDDGNVHTYGTPGFDNDTGSNTLPNVDYADLLGKVIAFGATTAQKSVQSLCGALVRGISIISLDNEVLAEVISSVAGTLAKKVVEKVLFDWLNNYLTGPGDVKEKQAFLAILSEVHDFLINDTALMAKGKKKVGPVG